MKYLLNNYEMTTNSRFETNHDYRFGQADRIIDYRAPNIKRRSTKLSYGLTTLFSIAKINLP